MVDVRDATPDDRSSILAIDSISRTDLARVQFIDHALQFNLSLIATINEELVGYGVLEYSFFGCGFISMIYVKEANRRQGVGVAIMNALAERCTTCKLFTSTNESNVPMQSLLQKLGFMSSGIIHNLDPGDPELVYFKPLDDTAQI